MLARFLLLFVGGAVVISFFDGFHTHGGATSYPDPVFLRMAWWTPLLFGSTAAFGGLLYSEGYRLLGGKRPTRDLALVVAFLLFAALYFASGFLPAGNATKAIVLAAGAVMAWAVVDRTWQGIVLAVITAIIGPVTEMILVASGAFLHLQPDYRGIPMWLPFLYLASGPAVGQIARRVLRGA